jgi:hypothetical protein
MGMIVCFIRTCDASQLLMSGAESACLRNRFLHSSGCQMLLVAAGHCTATLLM